MCVIDYIIDNYLHHTLRRNNKFIQKEKRGTSNNYFFCADIWLTCLISFHWWIDWISFIVIIEINKIIPIVKLMYTQDFPSSGYSQYKCLWCISRERRWQTYSQRYTWRYNISTIICEVLGGFTNLRELCRIENEANDQSKINILLNTSWEYYA